MAAYASGKSLWVFGDTIQKGGPFIADASAAIGSFTAGKAPRSLNELPTPPAAPATGRTSPSGFFKPPKGLMTSGSPEVACGSSGTSSYSADWVSGAATEPGSSTVLLTYMEMCVQPNFVFTTERLALVEYHPSTNTLTDPPLEPFAASPIGAGVPTGERLGSPVFGSDGYLYLFASDSRGAYVARVASGNHTAWGQASSYQWWSQPPNQALGWHGGSAVHYVVSVLPSGVSPKGINVADYAATTSKHLAMVVQTGLGASTFRVYEATSPTGTWSAGPAGQVPDACPVGAFGCYAIFGHAELSSSSQLVFSWYSTDDVDDVGHVRIGAIAW
jgi:hypothetical protein